MLPSLLTAAAFIGVALLFFLTGRLLVFSGRNRPDDVGGVNRRLVLGPFTDAFAGAIPVLAWTKRKLKSDLIKAGYLHRKALEEYLALRNAAVIAWLIFLAAAVVAAFEPNRELTWQILGIGGIVLLLIYSLPRLILAAQASARARRVQHALPDALDMMTMTMSGGLTLHRSLERVGEELAVAHPDLSCELKIIHAQTEAGSLEQALGQFAQRLELPDVIALASLVKNAARLGGNTASAFREYADTVRQSRRQRAEERGNKKQIKLLFPVVLCLAPPVYIMLLGPAVVELRNFLIRENQPGGVLSPSVNIEGAPILRQTFGE